ncbi:MAG: hydroxymethylglutaryl-CoA lyase [Flavobacteriaceae bacterium]|nr:hydroxymethylglutaryl-CoA lyase [Flavobacteriaceae bacterium]PHX84165.1 MAG: hydroxymethylglutaryl-CoA lyase [Flavobacteriales bacterium]
MEAITWIECPRDAMQGYASVFRTEDKIAYLRRLMAVGFDYLDLASFVSPKAIPQMFDSVQVLDALAPDKGLNKFLVIAANSQGIDAALAHEAVDAVGVPFSISPKFQIRNTKRSQEYALDDWAASMERLHASDKQLVVYLSMAFGNPYGEAYSIDLVAKWTARVVNRFQPHVLSISDTVGSASPEGIRSVVSVVRQESGTAKLGLHLHMSAANALSNGLLDAAWDSGIRRYDSALLGLGGCPYAQNELVGNLPTEALLTFATARGATFGIKPLALESAHNAAREFFNYI